MEGRHTAWVFSASGRRWCPMSIYEELMVIISIAGLLFKPLKYLKVKGTKK